MELPGAVETFHRQLTGSICQDQGAVYLLPYSQGCVELGTIMCDLRRISSEDSVRGEKRGQVDGSRDHSGNLQWKNFQVRQGEQILQAIIILQKSAHYGRGHCPACHPREDQEVLELHRARPPSSLGCPAGSL